MVEENDVELLKDVKGYVLSGGHDALSFSLLCWPKYNTVPGRKIQYLIDIERGDKK